MSATLPAAARRALEEATFCHVAARTERGPHLTPVVFVLDGGALWMTTSRASAKARAWRRDPFVAGMARTDTRGRRLPRARPDPRRARSPQLAGHLGRTRRRARHAPGSRSATPGSSPGTRSTPRACRSRGARPAGSSSACRCATGWSSTSKPASASPRGVRGRRAGRRPSSSFAPAPRPRPLDLRAPRTSAEPSEPPATAPWPSRDATVRWCCRSGGAAGPPRRAYEACLPKALLRPARATARPRVGLEVDRPGEWRAGADGRHAPARGGRGVLARRDARGAAALGERVPPGWALVRLRPSRVVWWRGWTSGTVAA